MNRKRQSIYWNPEKHPDFDAWVSEQENLSAAVRALYMKSRSRQGLSGKELVAMARELAPLVAPLGHREGAASIGTSILAEPISISNPPNLYQDKTLANARKTVNYFKKPGNQ